MADAAFALFDERGYEQTTVEDIAERAEVSRTTFFRTYRSKEDVIFPVHDRLLAAIRQRLDTSSTTTAIVAVTEAVRLVLLHYVEEGDRARKRYALTSRVAALRDREIASVAPYQRLFREFIADWMGSVPDAALRAELMASSVVAAHNHVLRRWLRGDTSSPIEEVDAALAQVVALFSTPAGEPHRGEGTTVVVFRTGESLDSVLPALRRAVEAGGTAS
ncbi:TetR/AcrR family transcriptional regulator [Nakamurella deserti]|uniref:TetR/AcrR family transcriptional regulator n=1 Tax=Nakamurella deserti TaxID=2164074 RepID=UPI0023E7FA15|nr:TetR/AcrR family transcriptional regulator [Nakamurella deserti]